MQEPRRANKAGRKAEGRKGQQQPRKKEVYGGRHGKEAREEERDEAKKLGARERERGGRRRGKEARKEEERKPRDKEGTGKGGARRGRGSQEARKEADVAEGRRACRNQCAGARQKETQKEGK